MSSALSSPGAPTAKAAIPYVATRHDAVRDLLWMADVGTNDVVYDLGSGVWRGRVRTEAGEGELQFTLHQRLSGVGGSFQLQGPTNLAGTVSADLWGDHLRCWCHSTNVGGYRDQMWIDGRIQGDRLAGGLRMFAGTNTVEVEWMAQRSKADFTGTWEWPGAFRVQRPAHRLDRHGQPHWLAHGGLGGILRGPS